MLVMPSGRRKIPCEIQAQTAAEARWLRPRNHPRAQDHVTEAPHSGCLQPQHIRGYSFASATGHEK